jgi:hypothetical protein
MARSRCATCAASDASTSKTTDGPRCSVGAALDVTGRCDDSAARFPSRATGKNRAGDACRRPWLYVSRITRRRSGISCTSGCANRRCSRILRNVSTNRLRSARRAEARTNNSWRAFRDGVECGSTMQGIAARLLTSAARLRVRALCAEAPLMWADKPSESCCQPLTGAKRIKPVREAQIDIDDFAVPIPIHLAARGAVHERSATFWTVAQHGAVLVEGRSRERCEPTPSMRGCLLGKARPGLLCEGRRCDRSTRRS